MRVRRTGNENPKERGRKLGGEGMRIVKRGRESGRWNGNREERSKIEGRGDKNMKERIGRRGEIERVRIGQKGGQEMS